MTDISVLSIDTAKNTFEVCGKTTTGRVVLRKKIARQRVNEVLAQQARGTVIAMEACGGSHYWGRQALSFGLQVRLIAPQFVKPFVKSNKHNRADAEAIGEAALRPTMRFVSVKTVQQQDTLSTHRVRERLVRQCTALINEIRGLLHEYGIVITRGAKRFRAEFHTVLEANKDKLSSKASELFNDLWVEFCEISARVEKYEKTVEREAKAHPVSKKLMDEVPGIGPITASALVAAVGDPRQFKNGREFAAWLGIVPRQHSTGDKPTLLGISKRGDTYLRTLLIHGARSVVRLAGKHNDRRSKWVLELAKRRGGNKAAVALANKNARVVWVLMTNPHATFDANHMPEKYRKAA